MTLFVCMESAICRDEARLRKDVVDLVGGGWVVVLDLEGGSSMARAWLVLMRGHVT